MAMYRKLGKKSDQRKALLRNQVTALLYYGRIETTEAKAKEIRKIAESLIALGIKEIMDGEGLNIHNFVLFVVLIIIASLITYFFPFWFII